MTDDGPTPRGRALLAAAAAAREAADLAYGLAAHVDDLDPAGAERRIQDARHLVIASQAVRRWTTIAELLGGMSWRDAADALQLNVGTVRSTFGTTVIRLDAGLYESRDGATAGSRLIGTPSDPDPEGTATALDVWVARHDDGIDAGSGMPGPVTRALTAARTSV